jgi:hypothetical protein
MLNDEIKKKNIDLKKNLNTKNKLSLWIVFCEVLGQNMLIGTLDLRHDLRTRMIIDNWE